VLGSGDGPTRHHRRSTQPVSSQLTVDARRRIAELLAGSPIPPSALPHNLPLYMRKDVVADILVINDLYQRILAVPGSVFEFGTRWGRRLSVLLALRELYEPYNYTRQIVGFDTFSGIPGVHEHDGAYTEIRVGSMSVVDDYADHLEEILDALESETAQGHIRRFDVCRGDVIRTLPEYLDAHPETIVSLAYFDLDLYEPTKTCLQAIRPHLVPGSVVAFDELAHQNFPGETVAVLQELASLRGTFEKLPYSRYPAFVTIQP
jgi:hypothetical protein